MGTIITDLKEAFRRGNIYIQLIYINVAVFVVTTLTEVILQLFNRSLGGVFEWLELPASLTQFIIQPWSLFTYMFMHAGFLHILFNMLWLYWFGALFLMFFSVNNCPFSTTPTHTVSILQSQKLMRMVVRVHPRCGQRSLLAFRTHLQSLYIHNKR